MENIQKKKTSKKAVISIIIGSIALVGNILSILLYNNIASIMNNSNSVAEAFAGALASVVLLAIWMLLDFVSLIFGIVALILSILSFKNSQILSKRNSIIGMVLGSISIIISILLFLLLIF